MIDTISILPKNILGDNVYIYDFEPLYDHRYSLILLVCQTYIDCRLKYKSTSYNDTIERLRMHSNKLSIFLQSNPTVKNKSAVA